MQNNATSLSLGLNLDDRTFGEGLGPSNVDMAEETKSWMCGSRRSSGSACGVATVRVLLSQHLALCGPSQDLPGRRISYCIVVRALWRSSDACNIQSRSLLSTRAVWRPMCASKVPFHPAAGKTIFSEADRCQERTLHRVIRPSY